MRKDRRKRRATARYTWDRLKVSFWFTPLVMSFAAMILVGVMIRLDDRIPNETLQYSRLVLSGTVGEMRTMLVGMAGTILSTAGVVFTLLTLPLSTVAAQYGSRLLRLFLGDRITQYVLGMFVATFVYCITAATSIPPEEVQPEAPQLLDTMGLVLMMACFASLILLIQHISTMLQAPKIAAAAGAELLDVVRAEIPSEVKIDGAILVTTQTNQEAPDFLPGNHSTHEKHAIKGVDGFPVRIKEAGYIQYIDPEEVLPLSIEKDLVIGMQRKPGDFVWIGAIVALVWPASRVDEELDSDIRHAFQVGNNRTPTQDIAYGVNQLVEMAVRAMSPAINDPFTAMTCLDYLGEGLALFYRQGEQGAYIYDEAGRLRLILKPVTFEELVNGAFDMLRHCSCDNASVLLHMLKVIDVIGQDAKSLEARQSLLRQVSLIVTESQAGDLIEQDMKTIQELGESIKVKWVTMP